MIARLKVWLQRISTSKHQVQEAAIRFLREDVDRLKIALEFAEHKCRSAEAGRRIAENRFKGLDFYLADLPSTREEVEWNQEESRALAAFLEQGVGEKLLKHLTNRLADYDRAAVLYSNQQNAALLCKRAHGFRDCRGEILRLSAAGPSPALNEDHGDALPAELENLRA